MNKFEKLLQEAEDNNVKVYDFDLGEEGLDGLYMDGNIALSDKLETTRQKVCTLAEELGHHYTTSGDILNQKDPRNRKQERIARGWAYNRLVPLEDIKRAYTNGYSESWEVAEFLEVDEEFLKDSIEFYQQKYGPNIFDIQEQDKLEYLLKILERT